MKKIDRRFFLKAMGVTAATLAVGIDKSEAGNAINTGELPELKGILYDSVKCEGCYGCEYDCAWQHELTEPGEIDDTVIRKTDDTRRTVVNLYQTSKGPVYVKKQCMNCNDPACGAACLTQAMHKTKDGSVIWREDKCMGCRYCMISCPYDMPKFEYHSTNPKIQKCDMCYVLQNEGEEPACAYNCPNGALLFGTRRELIAEANKRIAENPEVYYPHIYGEHEAGGSSWMYLSPVPFEELGFNTNIQNKSYPSLTKGFISSIAPVDILLPAVLLGIYEATKKDKSTQNMEEGQNE
ncbi:MAG: 4Fe-4S dicluster domain-containing protein [Bacteroidetes bacterium]|nr:4Fe-4S dicluster domain-containing protein [Bacteroidota bacterium]MBU1578929.1 4Fe-4S dicluster domain-containing protein [Bacteroidota bacterium]MBU2556974.1 4Fe-4S dicluster domain-containing protein [Bacteroidota bacterium]